MIRIFVFRRVGALFVLLILAIGLAACDSGIDPVFSRQAVPQGIALLPPDRFGIVVQPVAGVSEPFATEMATAIATALQDLNVPASLRGGAASSYFLTGDTAMTRNDDGSITLRLTWDLTGPDGTLIGTEELRERMPAPNEQTGPLLQQIAVRAAPQVAAMIQVGTPPAPIDVAAPSRTVSLGAISGAPGLGARDLAAALTGSLPLYGVALAEDGDTMYRLVCDVALTQVSPATQRIRLNWRVLDDNGTELGQLGQENDIPSGSLDGAWGEIAYLIADGVASGVAQILSRASG